MLLLDKKLLFIHIPKCAGTSIEVFFAGRDWSEINGRTKHLTAQEAVKHYGQETWDQCFTFSIVRNPWARFLSFFNLAKVAQPKLEFDKWIRRVCDKMGYNFAGVRVNRSMAEYLTDKDGRIMVDFVGRVESLQDDFRTIVGRAGGDPGELPHTMAVKYDHDYRRWYTPETRDLVARRFKDDVELFKYDY